jgi:hypothetical protein
MAAIKARLQSLEQSYLRPQAPREINLPSKISKSLLTLIERGIFHPDIFIESYVHIEHMLQQNGFDKFIKETNETHDYEVNKLRKFSSTEGSSSNIGLLPDQPTTSSSSRKSSRDVEKRFGFLPTVDLSPKIRSPGTLMPASISQSFSMRMQRSPSMGSNTPLAQIKTFAANLSPLIQSPLGDIPPTPTRRMRSPSVGSLTSPDKTGYVEGTSPKNISFLKQRLEKEISIGSGGEQSPKSMSVLKQRLEKEMLIGSSGDHIQIQSNSGIVELRIVDSETISQLSRTVASKRNFKIVPSSK